MERADLKAMNDEWEAWRSWCNYFKEKTEFDLNDARFNPLVAAVKRWGEELVALRSFHTEELRAKALEGCRQDSELKLE